MQETTTSIPSDFYKKGQGNAGDSVSEILKQKPYNKIEKIVFTEGGVYTYIEGALYPHTSFPTTQAIYSIDIVKKMIMMFVHTTASWQFIFSLPFILLSYKSFTSRLFELWTRIIDGAMADVYISEKYQTEFVKHVTLLVKNAIIRAGFDERRAGIMGEAVAHILYYDSAYFYRFIDLAREVNQLNLIINLKKEINRILDIFMVRESSPSIQLKTKRLVRLFNICLLIPSFKRAIKDILYEANWDILRGTDGDAYWMMTFEDYLYGGMTLKERKEMADILQLPLPTVYINGVKQP